MAFMCELGISAAVFTGSTAIIGQNGGGGYMDGYGHMMGPWGGGVFMWLGGLIVVGVLVYLLVKGFGGGGSPSQETALDILKKRYARGEITKEQFDEMKKDL